MNDNNYYVGIDMGTNSVGWAVTDCEYNIIRKKGKDMWGARLFQEAKTSQARRGFRTSRRRNARDVARRNMLKELFANEINKVDAGFLQRMDDSKYFPEDKTEVQKFALFANKNFTDKEYYKKYPTIFHLRKDLLNLDGENKEFDVRLVYLAVLNIFKHRGHFLNAGLDVESIDSIEEKLKELNLMINETLEMNIFEENNIEFLKNILINKNLVNSQKVENILNELNISKTKNKPLVEIIKMLCGLKGKISTIFDSVVMFDLEKSKLNISFRDGDIDENLQQLEEYLPEECIEILHAMKQIYDREMLVNILNNHKYLSCARVDLYEKHNKDLEILKTIIKQKVPEKYDDIFRVMKDNNYSAYVGSVNSKEEKRRRGAKCDKFHENIKAILKNIEDCDEKSYILTEIDKGDFLPKQLTSMNGIIPNQLHKNELKVILNNAEKYLCFLKEKDDSNLTVTERILMLFEFKIPYYVGPLSFGDNINEYSKNIWSVRRESGRILPWNFEEKIDVKESAERFIDRMVRQCTYISGKNVLPKNSLLYEKFMLLNELDNLRINGEKISADLKQELYIELFRKSRKGKKVTSQNLKEYLRVNGLVDNDQDIEISGIDGDFVNKLSNYVKFSDGIFKTKMLTKKQEKIAEDIIFWSTVYGESKSFLKDKIIENYGNDLEDWQIKRILGYKFKDWGNLSKELLNLRGEDKRTNVGMSVIERMWNENYNLSELLLSQNFTYGEKIKEMCKVVEKDIKEITYDDLEDTYASAPVKRMVWQTILVLKEIVQVMGGEPDKIFIEMTRTNEEKKGMEARKNSRKKYLIDLYKNCYDAEYDWIKEISEKDEREFRQKKLFLYYTQKGQCMYSGENIDLNDLFNNNLYDIDHIYPRHFVKDDSIFNNLVLVKKELNNHKSDTFPIEENIRKDRCVMWKALLDGQFISREKYNRLTRVNDISDEEKADFIARQIVETGQGTKILSKILENTMSITEIVYVKAGNVSDFRKKFDILKCRELNNYHHAQDAYLNIVVGNVYDVKFTKNPAKFIKDEYLKNKEKYNLNRMFDFDVVRKGVTAWNTEKNRSISTVKSNVYKNTPMITRMNYEVNGCIMNKQTLYSAENVRNAKAGTYISLKSSDEKFKDTLKYGGFTDITGSYFFIVEHTLKRNRVRTIEFMPVYLKDKYKTKDDKKRYCEEVLGYIEPDIRYNKIKMYSLIKVNGFYMYLTGRTGERFVVLNGVEMSMKMKFDKDNHNNSCKIANYIRNLVKLCENDYVVEGVTSDRNIILYDELTYIHRYTIFSKRPNSVGELLEEWKGNFVKCTVKDQAYILLQILQLTHNVNIGADLRKIGGNKKTGVSTIGKKISDKQEFKIVNESVTGIYREEIDLLTV